MKPSARRALVAFGLALLAAAPRSQDVQAPSAQELGALRARAFAAEGAHRFGEAADAFAELVRREPDRAEWLVAAGRCLGNSGRFREAIDLLDAGRKRFPGFVDVTAMLARTFLLRAEVDRGVIDPRVLWADAADLAEQVLTADPNHEDSRLVLAHARYQLGDWAAAVQQAEEAVRRHPTRAGAHMLLGRIAGDRLRELLERHERERPTGQAAADLVGEIAAQRELAQRSYRAAAKLDPGRSRPHAALGELAWLENRRDEARAHFADALVVDPDTPVDHTALGTGRTWPQIAEFYADARKRYAAGTAPAPAKLGQLLFHEGRARYETGQHVEATALLQQALAANPALSNSHWYLFRCASQVGDHDAAERHAAAYAAAGAPAFADVIRGLVGDQRGEVGAMVEFLANRAYQQQHTAASRDLNHVVACLKDTADAWNNHAFLCRETGRFDDALASYQHALEKEPDSPQLLNDMGVVLQYHLVSADNRAKARALYERVVPLAEQQLKSGKLAPAERERVSKAMADARANLAALDK